MGHWAAGCHPLPDLLSTATGITRRVPAYSDRETATWDLLDPEEGICLYCALPASTTSLDPPGAEVSDLIGGDQP